MEFFKIFFGTVVLCLVCWVAIVAGQAGNPTRMSQWISDAYAKKEKYAREIAGRKIVIVAGSNALFGVDSSMLEEALGMPVINDAVNAGVELPCTLFISQRVIGEGDVVILPLEHSMYAYNGKPGVQMIDFLFAREPKCFWKLHFSEQLYLLWHISFSRIVEGYRETGGTAVTQGVYGAHHIDVHGDQTHTAVKERSADMFRDVQERYHDNAPYTYGKDFSRKAPGWKYLKDFVAWCNERHATVIFMPATLLPDESYFKEPKERWFFTHIADEVQKHGWIYAGKPYDYMYDEKYYFNTDSHLTDEGRKLRTEQMIKDLKSVSSLFGR